MGNVQAGVGIIYAIFVYILPLIISISFAGICSGIAQSKGRSSVGWGFLGFFFGLIAVILIAVASNLEKEREMYELLYSLQHEESGAKRKNVLIAKSSNGSYNFKIERIGKFESEVRALFTLSNSNDEPLYEKDLILNIKHDLEESDVTDIRWLENKIEVDILHSRKKPPRTYTFEY